MKKLIILIVILISMGGAVNAQKNNFGHINSNELLLAMPERKQAEKELQDYAKQLENQLTAMSNEYQTKLSEFQSKQATMAASVRNAKAEEIANLEKRIQQFQMSAQEDLQTKESELMQPLIDKAKKAIDEVAKEKGYTYVFDTSAGSLLHFPEGDNILSEVKKKMGLQ